MDIRLVRNSVVALSILALLLLGSSTATAAPPANDNFSAAQVIGPGLPISVPASNIEATAQPLEPAIGGNNAISTVWYQWTAPAAGPVVVNLCNSGFTGSDSAFVAFAVRTGAALNALMLVEDQLGDCLLRFNAVNGTVYSIQVDYRNNQGNFTFRMRQQTPPVNDNFPGTTIGPGLPVNLPSTNLDSTFQVGELPFLGGATNSRSVWYSWTAPATGQVRLDVCDFVRISGPANKVLAAYTGVVIGGLVAVATTDNCELSFVANSGTTYRIAFSGHIAGEGTFTLRLRNAPPPANDDFANAQVIGPQLPVKLQATNEFSTAQAGEPGHGGIGPTAHYSSWYSWTAPTSARVRIKSCSRTFNARLGVYTGAAVNALTEAGESPLYAPHCSKILNAVAGTTYRIAAAGGTQEGEYGTFELDVHVLDIPANDNLSDAQAFSPELPSSINGSTTDASYEDSEPSHDDDSSQKTASVWYRWTAQSADAIIFSACSQTEATRVAVYSGIVYEDLQKIDQAAEGCPDGSLGGRLAIAPNSGETYLIAVSAAERDYESDFTLTSTGPPLAPPVVNPPKQGFSLKKAIRKCKKIKSKKKRAACIKKARKKAAIIKCRKIVNPGKEKKCIRKAQRKFR